MLTVAVNVVGNTFTVSVGVVVYDDPHTGAVAVIVYMLPLSSFVVDTLAVPVELVELAIALEPPVHA